MKLGIVVLFFAVFALFSAQNIIIRSFTFIPACKSDRDCLQGYYCNSSLICQDRCIMMRCTASTVCKEGGCRQICDDKTPCKDGYICTMGYCMDKCRYMTCKSGYSCQLGACVTNLTECTADKNCKTGFYCSKDSKCVDKCSKENYCKQGQKCEKEECKKEELPCIDPKCPQRFTCSNPRPTQKTCPTVYFFRKPDPVVCGVTKNGTLVDYPIQCYACKDTAIIYYFNVTCDQVPRNCTRKNNGKICSEEIQCKNPRPNEKTCPTLTWIRQPDPLVCGVDKLGEYVDFPVECYACKSKNITFYYNKTCAQVRKKNTQVTCAQVSCPVGQMCKDGKCIDPPSSKLINCKSPRPTQKDCPTINFIKKPDPVVCGVTKTGEHKDFQVECYACKSKQIVGYYNTTCDNVKCADVKCKGGQKCVDGKCVSTKWPVCQKGVKKQQCGKKRPTQQSCPLIYFFVQPPNIVCGVTSTNQRISYPVECYACKNTDVQYYYNKSCQELSKPCKEQKTAAADNGSERKCKADTDCEKGFYCQGDMCVDKCIVTLCPTGTTCQKGQCLKISGRQTKSCQKVQCRQGQKCQNGECVDKCNDVICIATHTCVDGECVLIPV